MSNAPLRAGLIGCGAIGSRYDEGRAADGPVYTHAGMFALAPGIDFACIAEPDPARREACRSAWGVAAYADHRKMLARERLDLVGLATPDETHAVLLVDVLDLAKPRVVFTEKPLAQGAAEARALGARFEAAGVALLVDYVRRHDENHAALRDFLAGGGIGRVHTARATYVRGIRHNGCQMVNLLRFLLGEPLRVRAFGPDQGSLPGDPSLDLRLEFPDGAVAQVAALDRAGYAFSSFTAEFAGDTGVLHLDATGRDIRLERVEPFAEFPGFARLAPAPTPWPVETYGRAMLRAGEEIVAAAAGRCPVPRSNWREAARDLEIIEAALASARAGGADIGIPAPRDL